VIECVLNLSEGRDLVLLDRLAASCGRSLLDVHRDPDHNRAVFTLAGPDVRDAARALAEKAVAAIDVSRHSGAHPRLGAVDVVPFVALPGSSRADAARERDDFAAWAGESLGVPCFLYGFGTGPRERTLPEVRRGAFGEITPDYGPPRPHPAAGAMAVGARPPLVAYNLWLEEAAPKQAKSLAARLRSTAVRALAFDLGGRAQLSFNLLEPELVGPQHVYGAVAAVARIERAELVGLLPSSVLDRVPRTSWGRLGLSPDSTVEARLERLARLPPTAPET
jgi:glutamate formiminotransferase